MNARVLNPALALLLRDLASARLKRFTRGFATPRKLALSCIGVVLAVIWLGNAAASVVFREPWAPGALRSDVPLALLAYALWHVLKTACCRPQEGIAWRPAEREMLLGGPFQRRELAAYHLAAIATAAVLKAGVFTLLMLPDLQLPGAAFAGAVLALLLIDLFRLGAEIVAANVSRRAYLKYRAAALLAFGAAAGSAVVTALSAPATVTAGETYGSLGLVLRLFRGAAELRQTWIGCVLESPFAVFAEIITAPSYSPALAGWLTLAFAMTAAAAWLVFRLDALVTRAAAQRERREYGQVARQAAHSATMLARRNLPSTWFRGGAAALAWRQFVGVRSQITGLLLALVAPMVLASIPLLVAKDSNAALLNVVGGLVFYTFLLVPAAVKFDFRRDIERMLLLKSLPVRPTAVVLGQLAAPVTVAWSFQSAVLLAAWVVRPIDAGHIFAALLLLGPVNVLIFALENLIYLLYPYRLQQEGIEIFLRSTLTFTAKGLLFALALVAALGWASASARLAAFGGFGSPADNRVLFAIGAVAALCFAAAATTLALVRAYARFDPVQDMPA